MARQAGERATPPSLPLRSTTCQPRAFESTLQEIRSVRIKLSSVEIGLLLKVAERVSVSCKLAAALHGGPYLAKGQYATGQYVIDCTYEEALHLIEKLSDELLNTELDKSGELTEAGYLIESLIDRLQPSPQ